MQESQDVLELHQPLLAAPAESQALSAPVRTNSTWVRVAVAAAVGIPLEVIALGGLLPAPALWTSVALLAGSFVAIGIAAYPYLRGFYYTLRHPGKNPPDMDTLVSLSCGMAWTYALLILLVPSLHHELPSLVAYLADPLMTLSILNSSHMVRDRIQQKITARTDAIRTALRRRVPAQVTKQSGEWIALSDVLVNDVICVDPGEYIPVDGVLVSNTATLGEMTLESGENNHVERTSGGIVLAGMKNVGQEPIWIRAQCKGGESKYNKMLAGLDKQDPKSINLHGVLKKAIYVFVPGILLIAAISFVVWNFHFGLFAVAIHSMLGVLFGACPCALALAVPLSMVIGRYAALQRNILVRREQAVAVLPKVSMVVFDKTGTLTTPEVVNAEYAEGVDPANAVREPLLRMERDASHPMARALLRFSQQQRIESNQPALTTTAVRGGICATEGDRHYFIGGYEGVTTQGLTLEKPAQEMLYFVENRRILAAFTLKQTPRPAAVDLINSLKQRGIAVRLLSGGSVSSVRAVATQLGIADYDAEQPPENKEVIIGDLKRDGHTIAYVGDGLNDVAAAQASDLSIAVGPEVGLSPYADVVMNDLADLMPFMQIAIDTMRNIKQNLAWSVGYNIAMIVLVTLVLPLLGVTLSHTIMGLAMAISSIVVIVNVARMLRKLTSPKPITPTDSKASLFQVPSASTHTIQISGVNCGGCVNGLTTLLTGIDGVSEINVALPQDRVSVVTITSSLSRDHLYNTIVSKLNGSKFTLQQQAVAAPTPV